MGIDGITFLNGTLYVNNVFFNNLYRIPVDAAGKAGTACRYLDGPAGQRAGWHARGEWQALRRRKWQRQNFRHHRQWRQGKRHGDQGRTQNTNRSRACRRYYLDRRARRRQGRVDPHAQIVADSFQVARFMAAGGISSRTLRTLIRFQYSRSGVPNRFLKNMKSTPTMMAAIATT